MRPFKIPHIRGNSIHLCIYSLPCFFLVLQSNVNVPDTMDYDIGDINITDILNITSAANFYQVEYFGNLELMGANSTDDIHVCCLSDMT